MKVTSKGKVTIPLEIRERLGFYENTEVDFVVEGNAVRLVKARQPRGPSRGQRVVEGLRGKAQLGLTTDEIMAMTRGEDE